jgi:DNA (cytosine-5)-methyltransferase 1
MATHGSLFSGIGGIDLGFEWAGIDTLWQVEIDPYCRNLLEMRFPNAARYEDVNKVGSHNLQPVDIISGGFPCQDISYAGKGAGIDGSRSGLWSQLHRVIGELRPRFALIENVPALLKRGLDRVLSDLADIGYDAEWQVISAKDVGAPHLRKRVWIVAYTQHSADRTNGGQEGEKKSVQGINREEGRSGLSGRTGCNATDVADTKVSGKRTRLREGESTEKRGRRSGNIGGEDAVANTKRGRCGKNGEQRGVEEIYGSGTHAKLPPKKSSADVADTGSGRLQGGENTGNNQGDGAESNDEQSQRLHRSNRSSGEGQVGWLPEPDVGRVAHGIPSRVDRLKGLGNAVVPHIPHLIGVRLKYLIDQTNYTM